MKITIQYLKRLILEEIKNLQQDGPLRQMECGAYEEFGDKYYLMDLDQDMFIHFTPRSRANEIIKSNKLLFDPPHKAFGPEGVFAVSSVWGIHLPSVQTTHIKLEPDDDIVAILFTTKTMPKWGHTEEVFWEDVDVVFEDADIIEESEAIEILKNTIPMPEDSNVYYEMPSWCEGFKNE